MFKRGMTGEVYLHLNDEAPRIGSGFRRVQYKVGNRHVTLTSPHTGRKAKLLRELFERLVELTRARL